MKLIKHLAAVFILVSVSSSQQLSIGYDRFVAGVLAGDDGTAIVGAIVTLHRTEPHRPGKPKKTEWSATSGPGGTFLFNDVYEGQYRLCAQAPGSPWLDPCEWNLRPITASLSGGQRSVNVAMVMNKGAVVPFRVDDASQLLSRHEGKTSGAHLLLAVSNDASVFRPAMVTSQDASGRNQQIVIPFDTPVKLVAFSSFFRLTDSAGLELSRAGATKISITVPSGNTPVGIRLAVIGSGR